MTKQCGHPRRTDGVCDDCGHCLHEVILNHQCYFCGATENLVRNDPGDFVPLARVARSSEGEE